PAKKTTPIKDNTDTRLSHRGRWVPVRSTPILRRWSARKARPNVIPTKVMHPRFEETRRRKKEPYTNNVGRSSGRAQATSLHKARRHDYQISQGASRNSQT
ncbi:unnamed protein product, partial [Ectocarpus sp. 12 AP-2014]